MHMAPFRIHLIIFPSNHFQSLNNSIANNQTGQIAPTIPNSTAKLVINFPIEWGMVILQPFLLRGIGCVWAEDVFVAISEGFAEGVKLRIPKFAPEKVVSGQAADF